MTTSRLALLLTLLLLGGCAGSRREILPMTVTLARAGGFSGLEERFVVHSSHRVQKFAKFPNTGEVIKADTTLPGYEIDSLFAHVDRNFERLAAIEFNESGNMTTTLVLERGQQRHTLRWPNLEPPTPGYSVLDSVYEYMADIPARLRIQP